MVSLGAVEGYATNIWPEYLHVALSVNDPKKGEQIILLTNCKEANRNALQAWYKEHHVNELALPKRIVIVEEVQVLGTGKIDYVASQKTVSYTHLDVYKRQVCNLPFFTKSAVF